MKRPLVILLIMFVCSCGSDYGNKVIGDNLTVFFTDKKDVSLAEDIARYWKGNNLITGQKQDLQLVRMQKKMQLRLIQSSKESLANMSFDERKLLTDLQTDIYKTIIKEPFELVICNEKFEPIYTMNE